MNHTMMSQDHMMSHALSGMGWHHGGSLASIIFIAVSVIVIILIVKMIVGLTILARHRRPTAKARQKDRLADYKAAGLTEHDIALFRETMAEAKAHIISWERATAGLTDLSVIEDVTGGLAASKQLFQAIVKAPSELTKQNDFLYKKLPNMVKLTEKLTAMQAETTRRDEDIAETLLLAKTLSASIAKDYHDFLMKDVKIIEKEIEADD